MNLIPRQRLLLVSIAAFVIALLMADVSNSFGQTPTPPPIIDLGTQGNRQPPQTVVPRSPYPPGPMPSQPILPPPTSRIRPQDVGGPAVVTDPQRTLHYLYRIYPGTGSFSNPNFLFYDEPNDRLYVTDYTNNRIIVYNAAGTYIAPFTFGTGGSGNGQFAGPGGVTVVGSSIFVADCNNHRIQKFDRTSGAFQSAFGSFGTGTGNLFCPSGIAYSPFNGQLYVVENGNNRIHRYDTSGNSLGVFGSFGTGNGQLSSPFGIAADTFGNLYVGDSQNNRVVKYNASGFWQRNIGSAGTAAGQLTFPTGVSIDRAGLIYVVDTNNFRVQKFDWQGNFRANYGIFGSCGGMFGTTCNGFFFAPRGIAANGNGTKVFVSDGSNNTVQVFEQALTPTTSKFMDLYSNQGTADGLFNGIGGAAVDSKENVYYTDFNNNRVQKFDKFGNFLLKWGTPGTGNGQFNNPYGIAIDQNDNVYVADSSNHRIQKFNSSGGYLGQFGSLGTGTTQFTYPQGIAVDGTSIYVADSNNDRIVKFDYSFGYQRQWGTHGSGNLQFNVPIGVAVDATRGLVYVGDYLNNRLQIFTVYGDFVRTAVSTSGLCALNQPIGVAADQRGNVYVADRANNRVAQFNGDGNCIASLANSTLASAVAITRKNGQVYTGGSSGDSSIRRYGAPNPRSDTIGVWRPSSATYLLRNSNTGGFADITASPLFAATTDLPVVGDWNGDGIDTPGIYRPSTSVFYLFNSWNSPNMSQPSIPTIIMGNPGDAPIAGDWDADGQDSIGTYRPSNGILYLRNALSTGYSDYAMVLGNPSDIGIGGDWDGDGVDSAGIYRPSNNGFYLTDKNTNGIVFSDHFVVLGSSGDKPFTGDWTHQGSSGLGVFRPSTAVLFLKYTLSGIYPDTSIGYGAAGDTGIGGSWGPVPGAPLPPPLDAPPQYSVPPILVNGGQAPPKSTVEPSNGGLD